MHTLARATMKIGLTCWTELRSKALEHWWHMRWPWSENVFEVFCM